MRRKQKGQNSAEKVTWNEKNRTLSMDEEPILVYELRCPKLEGKTGRTRRIDRYYRKMETIWEKRWQGQLYARACAELNARRAASRQFDPWRCRLTGEVTLEDGMQLALRMEVQEIYGDGKPCLLRWGEIWDLENGAPVTVRALWGRKENWRREVHRQIREQINRRQASGECFFDRGWEEELPKLLRRIEPGSTEQGLEIYLPQGAIAPSVEGVPTFTVCRREKEGREKGEADQV